MKYLYLRDVSPQTKMRRCEYQYSDSVISKDDINPDEGDKQ
jgi:hypothetical protein